MLKRHLKLKIAAFGLTFGLAAGASALQAGRVDGFGPNIADDSSLNRHLGALTQQIAWLNSPESDAYQLAEGNPRNADFVEVAQMSTGSDAQGYFPSIAGDDTLNRSNGLISQLIAWQNSSAGDAFMVAQAEPSVTGEMFQRVALASLQ